MSSLLLPGESVRWKTNRRNWLGPGEGPLSLIALVDEASGRATARLTREDSVEENFETLRCYVEKFGRPKSVRTDRSTLFGCQIRRALSELDIECIPAETPRVRGLAAVFFDRTEENLLSELNAARARDFVSATSYVESVYLPEWNASVSEPVPDDNRRPLLPEHDLESICCIVVTRQLSPDRTIRFNRICYRVPDLPGVDAGGKICVESRADGRITARHNGIPMSLTRVDHTSVEERPARKRIRVSQTPPKNALPSGGRNRDWMTGFFSQPAPPIWKLVR